MPDSPYLNYEGGESHAYTSQIREGSHGIIVVKNSLHAPFLEDADFEQNYGEQLLAVKET